MKTLYINDVKAAPALTQLVVKLYNDNATRNYTNELSAD